MTILLASSDESLLRPLCPIANALRQSIEESRGGGENLAAAPMADMAVGKPATPEVLFPPLPLAASDKPGVSAGLTRELGSKTTPGSTASAAASSPVSASHDEVEVVEVQNVGGDVDTANREEESVEDLLGSLMRTLNTEQGRADFRLLASGATS